MQSHLLPLGHPNPLELPLQFVHLAQFDHSGRFDHPAQPDLHVQVEVLEQQGLQMQLELSDNLGKMS